MCDQHTEQDIENFAANGGNVNRRDFAKLLALGAVSTAFPHYAFAESSIQSTPVTVATPDGEVDSLFIAPKTGKHPAIVIWPDIKGRREAFDIMGKRLAAQGYAVLVVNPFYRDLKGAALPEGVSFPSQQAWSILGPMRAKLTQAAVNRDNRAFFAFLDKQASVDTARQGAVMGFCMSGTYTIFAAADMPERIGAIASFHGGGLATSNDDSPHLLVGKTDAKALHAIAENDHEKDPQMKALLTEAYQQAGIDAEIEVYAGTLHGWTPLDSRVYHKEQAERAWERMSALFAAAL